MILFYLFYAVLYILFHISGESSHMLYLLLCGVIVVYKPIMFFIAGRDICFLNQKSNSSETFKESIVHRLVIFFVLYWILSVFALHFINGQELYLAVRNALAFNVVPGISGIWASLGFLYLLVVVFYKQFSVSEKKTIIVSVLSFAGFLMVFIPEGLFGYALIGLFIGGDIFGCVPVAVYLTAFFWGLYTGITGEITLKDKTNRVLSVILIIASIIFALLRQKEALFVSAGTLIAFFAIWAISPFFVICRKAHPLVLKVPALLKDSIVSLDEVNKERFLSGKNIKRLGVFLCGYILLFIITAVMVFLPLIYLKQSLVWEGDALSQYIPRLHRFIKYIPSVVQSVIHGNFDIPVFDYSTALGTPFSITFRPLDYLYLILPKGNIDINYTFLSLLRYFLAGLSMAVMVIYFKHSYLSAYTSALAYAFSGYAVFAGTRHYQFIIPLITLPLMVVAMERLICYKKWYALSILVTISLVCSYYTFYMTTIGLGCYFLCRVLFNREYRSFKFFISRGIIIAGSYLMGTCLGMVSIASEFGGYLNSGRSGGKSAGSFLSHLVFFYRRSWLSDMFLSSVSYDFSPGYWLKIGTIPLTVLGAVLLFARKERRDVKALFCCLSAFCFIPFAAYVFSGFSSVTNRWSYIWTALAGFLIAFFIDRMDGLTKKEMLFLTGAVIYYLLLVYFDARMQSKGMYADAAFMAVTLCVVLLVNAKEVHIPSYYGKLLVCGISILTIAFNSSNLITQKTKKGTMRISYTNYDSAKRLSGTSLRDLDKIPEYLDADDFFRCTNIRGNGYTNCFNMVNGHNDIATFTSVLPRELVDYNRNMGNSRWTLVRIFDYNFRTIMQELASIKYIGTTAKNQDAYVPYGYERVHTTEDGLSIYKNNYELPLAYTYDTVISETEAEKETAIRKQEITLNAAILEDEALKKGSSLKQQIDAPMLSHEVPCTMECDGVAFQDDLLLIEKENASVTFSFDSDPNAETYLMMDSDLQYINGGTSKTKGITIVEGKNKLGYQLRNDTYKTSQTEHVWNLGYHKEAIHSCSIVFSKPGSMTFDSFHIYSQPMDNYERAVNNRKEDILEDVTINNNTVQGDIELSRDKMLVITFPYQNGWTAYVDGKEAPILKTNYQYMGLVLEKGKHQIRLHYQMPGLKLAFIITFLSGTLFIIIILFNAVRKRRCPDQARFTG